MTPADSLTNCMCEDLSLFMANIPLIILVQVYLMCNALTLLNPRLTKALFWPDSTYLKYCHVTCLSLFDFAVGQVNTALQLGPEEFKEKYGGEMPQQTDNVVFSCLAGVRSKNALDTAASLGYKEWDMYSGKSQINCVSSLNLQISELF